MNFILISEASELIGINRQSIRNWIDKGIIPAQKINGTFYVDRDTFLTLSEKMRDVETARQRLEALQETYIKETDMYHDMRQATHDGHNILRYLSVCVNNGIRTRFFETIVRMMLNKGILTEKEADVLTDVLYGMDYNEVAKKYNSSRERIRQIAEKAIRNSQALVNDDTDIIKAKDEEINSLKDEIASLKRILYRDAIRTAEDGLSDTEKALARKDFYELMALLSRPLANEPFMVRTKNALICYTENGVRREIKTLGELCRVSEKSIKNQRNVGKKVLDELTQYLESNGLTWGMDIDRILGLK